MEYFLFIFYFVSFYFCFVKFCKIKNNKWSIFADGVRTKRRKTDECKTGPFVLCFIKQDPKKATA